MKNFIAITICFIVGLIMCQESKGQQETFVLKTTEVQQSVDTCETCYKTPLRNVVKNVGCHAHKIGDMAVDMTKNTLCQTKNMICKTLHRTSCAGKRVVSRARSFTRKVLSRPCCS